MGMTQCREPGLLSGTEGLRKGVGGLPQAGPRKMSSLSARSCMEISAWLLEWLQMSWTWTARRCGQSLRKIWGWGRSVQKCFWSCWKSSMCRCVMTSRNNSKWSLAGEGNHRWRVMDYWVRFGDQTTESSVEESDITEAEESKDGQVQYQSDVNCIL